MVVWAWPVNFIPQTACHLLAKITILCDNNQIDRFYWNNLTKVVITLDFVTQNNIGGEYGRLEIKIVDMKSCPRSVIVDMMWRSCDLLHISIRVGYPQHTVVVFHLQP